MALLNSLKERSTIVKEVGIRVYQDNDGTPIIEAHKSDQIKTLDQLLEAAEVDKDQWEVERHEANVWNQMSSANGLVHLWQVKAKLKRKDLSKENLNELFKTGWAAFKRGLSIVPKKGAKPHKAGVGKLALLSIPDLHLGKLAWDPETGHGNYDTAIACDVHRSAVADLVVRSPKCEECWFIVGNDFFNVDSMQKTTTSGTPQDEDGRWQKTFRKGQELLMEAIGILRKKYPMVRVIVMPGNHDRQRMWYLGENLATAFEGVDGVEVDNRPLFRKYYRWGNTGFGLAHGDGLKDKNVPALAQGEARGIWGQTKWFEFLIGHLHHSSAKLIQTVGWLGAIKLRILPSLSAADSWHAANGYVLADRAAELSIYDKEVGIEQVLHYRPEVEFYS